MSDSLEATHHAPIVRSRQQPCSRQQLAEDLVRLGLQSGTDALINSSLRAIGPVDGGAATVLAALRAVLGPRATVVVPSQTPANSATSSAHREAVAGMTAVEIAGYRERFPPFDPARTPSAGMGAFAEHVRLQPGACRSGHPTSSFAALGPAAERITALHPLHSHLGPESPLGALAESGAQVLLLGVGFAKCTAFHLAEYRVRPETRTYSSKLADLSRPGGGGRWIEYRAIRLDASDFDRLGADLAASRSWVRNGTVGAAPSACFPLASAVRFAEQWLSEHRPG
ncbi:Aminoglycoside N(3')-acetyltransferase [Catenulispora acidiphila DSM 44928]|uniref:Aminoglycoside N(3)-acetyltransferase n=1 Tax=Catenulispora acidiphila (strain DSM 44928 / JCM 14897 / NBRC 102108 / NRRL B-24433 / ID139908) TaxID=479433 RepID=C7PXA8_CATAD|nr:AAC(3) family N-acetyltransferase [Catenulispora acidiphila]ACU69459.1 Aminoglycoside N(3')-acetyltransferase [Catenulispora acidiphila DSM 44928]